MKKGGPCVVEFRRKFADFFHSAGIKLRNSVKFRGIQLNTEFRNLRIPPEQFFHGIIDTLVCGVEWIYGLRYKSFCQWLINLLVSACQRIRIDFFHFDLIYYFIDLLIHCIQFYCLLKYIFYFIKIIELFFFISEFTVHFHLGVKCLFSSMSLLFTFIKRSFVFLALGVYCLHLSWSFCFVFYVLV